MKGERGSYTRLITDRDKIRQMTGRLPALMRTRKDGTSYPIRPKPYCSKCKKPVRKLYEINAHYRREQVPRQNHVAYRCPSCGALFSRRLVTQEVEVFEDDA